MKKIQKSVLKDQWQIANCHALTCLSVNLSHLKHLSGCRVGTIFINMRGASYS